MTKYTKGKIVKGTVSGIETYGAFINLDEYYSGLIHISEISHGFVRDIHDFLKIGDTIYVEIIGVDDNLCHLNLSIKDINYKTRPRTKNHRILETNLGFKTLAYNLPIWIEQKLQKDEKL